MRSGGQMSGRAWGVGNFRRAVLSQFSPRGAVPANDGEGKADGKIADGYEQNKED